MTMEELLKSLIKKTKVECEEAHRQQVAAMNGLAGLSIIREEVRAYVLNYCIQVLFRVVEISV